ncbi:MAG TPA: hypothetical protein VGS19_07440 [Streptosporangiaceae bacterium]|nr:hypothetical protein [Streptosporangiaceae bacterium]
MYTRDGITLSTVIMSHPSRASLVPALVAACAPLGARRVADPDPAGIPSPLRTAKRAWAASLPGATHHLVLQDDVLPSADFADRVLAAVRARPDDAIALYVHWHSPLNAYLTRLAAVAGSPWAALSHREWVPTQGLVLPVAEAHGLARWLARYPDEVRDDDELVVEYCAARGLRVLATVPNLVEHGDGPSLTWDQAAGVHHATVSTEPAQPVDWRDQHLLDTRLLGRAYDTGHVDFSVGLQDSRCDIRLLPGVGETIGTLCTWPWMDAARAIGVHEQDVLASFATHSDTYPSLTSTDTGTARLREVWAAGYLLGRDCARLGGSRPTDPSRRHVRAGALESWLRSGVSEANLTREQRAALHDALLSAVGEGERAEPALRGRVTGGLARYRLPAGAEAVLTGLATRDARGLALPPARATGDDQSGLSRMDLHLLTCPWCGMADADTGELLRTLPFDGITIVSPGEYVHAGAPSLSMLACERPSQRSLVAVARAVEDGGPDDIRFRTRAVAYLESGFPLDPASGELAAALAALDDLEQRAVPVLVLPCATSAAVGGAVTPVSHHLPWERLGDALLCYLDRRAAELSRVITGRARVGPRLRSWDPAGGP